MSVVSSIQCDAGGFSVIGSRQSLHERATWDEITQVTVFKRDLITTDLICLELK